MSFIAHYLVRAVVGLKPTWNPTENPIKLLAKLNKKQWNFFLVWLAVTYSSAILSCASTHRALQHADVRYYSSASADGRGMVRTSCSKLSLKTHADLVRPLEAFDFFTVSGPQSDLTSGKAHTIHRYRSPLKTWRRLSARPMQTSRGALALYLCFVLSER
jgi:hypothetical protein